MFDMQRLESPQVDLIESPSKTSKIVMRYIANLPDVGPSVKQQPVSYETLVDLAKNLDKAEIWSRNDLRLIFSMDDIDRLDVTLSTLEDIVNQKNQL